MPENCNGFMKRRTSVEVGENWLEGYRIVAEERFAMYLDEMTSIKNRDEMPHSGPVRPGKPHGSYGCHLQGTD